MEVPRLGNFISAQKQTTEKNEVSKDGRPSALAQHQLMAPHEAQNNLIPPVNETSKISGEEGNKAPAKSGPNRVVDLLA
jgi:hypothetical protein